MSDKIKFPGEDLDKIIELDEIDKNILRILQADSKTSLRSIADKTKHSVSTIKSHIDRLVNECVIENFIAVVDCNRIGYREMLHFYIQIRPEVKINQVIEELTKIRKINCIYHVSGDYPIFCIAKCVAKKDQIELLEQIKSINGIEKLTTQVVLQRVKEDMRVSIPE
jgi:Lrp/AsnC family transcriptional regulator for asnA, asnC and gidA